MSSLRPASAEEGALAPLIKVEGITKSFAGARALRGVDLQVLPGEVHALLGENGAGKSTLIKILSGVHSSDGGSISIGGRKVSFSNPAQSRDSGIAVVYQDLSLVESLTVADNLLLGREPKHPLGFLKKRELVKEAERFLTDLGIPLDPRAKVSTLPFAYRQMTEIAKALIGDVRLLILDEPTSSLTGDEVQILFDAVAKVTSRGVGVIYVTHRLDEVFEISQRVTVFRDGLNAGTFVTAETDMKKLVSTIIGNAHVAEAEPMDATEASSRVTNIPALTLDQVSNDRLRSVDLTVYKGEIHGLAGLIGSGRTEILETVFGLRPATKGTVSINGTAATLKSPKQAIAKGVALVPEDRHVQGVVLDHSIERNISLTQLRRFSSWGWMHKRKALAQAQAAVTKLSVKAQGTGSLVKTLSGGNQQKVVFAKWSDPRPNVLLLDEPSVGVDVGAREEIYGVIRSAAVEGTGVLVVSSDLVELLLLCDRISVVVEGGIVRTFPRGTVKNAEDLHHLLQQSQTEYERTIYGVPA